MENWNIISSSSDGNCVIYRDVIMIDLGIKLKDFHLIEPFIDKVKIIIISHRHTDHIQLPLMKKILRDYSHIMFVYGQFVRDWLDEKLVSKVKGEVVPIKVPNEFIVSPAKYFRASKSGILIIPIALYHDVPNYGFYMKFTDDKTTKGYYDIFHATDTYKLDGIKIPNDIDLVAIEHHHSQEHYDGVIEKKIAAEEFSHEIGANNSHFSFDKATEFLKDMNIDMCEVLRLHMSTDEFYSKFPLSYTFIKES